MRSPTAWLGAAWVAVGALCAVALPLSACSPPALSEDGQLLDPYRGQGLVKSPRSPVPDAPMPVGFVMIAKSSRAYAVGSGRYVEHRYQGQSPLGDAVKFYREQLPANGWQRASEVTEPSVFVTQYRKGTEVLDLRLTREGRVLDVNLRIMDPAIGDPRSPRVAPYPAAP